MSQANENNTVKIVYILYMIGILLPILSVIAVIVAYVSRSDADADLQTHYTFQIRTFWISLLIQLIGWFTLVIGIGWLILLGWLIWLLVRCIKGYQLVNKFLPHPAPKSWLLS